VKTTATAIYAIFMAFSMHVFMASSVRIFMASSVRVLYRFRCVFCGVFNACFEPLSMRVLNRFNTANRSLTAK
jgi:hypothetical protein